MESITIKQITAAVHGVCQEQYNAFSINNVCTDSRKIQKGDLYIALIGETFDGHQFIQEVISKGASALIVSKPLEIIEGIPTIVVDDTLHALGQLALFYRQMFSKPVIAVTGSVGKTSTKDLISTVLSSKFNVHKSLENFNNEIGLPKSIFGIQKSHDVVVLEMGMWAEGEIRQLTEIARPNIAVITNIGISHIERLKTQDNILKAKLEIVEGLEENGVLILNANDPLLRSVDQNIAQRIIYVGVDIESDFRAYCVVNDGEKGVSFKIDLEGKTHTVHLSAVGTHNVLNALIAIACAVELGLKPEDFIPQLKSYRSGEKRLNLIEKEGIKFIDDTYNASPDSMQAGLNVLKSLARGYRAIAIIGNMFELGEMSAIAHYTIGKACGQLKIDFVAIMGENALDVVKGIGLDCHYQVFESHEAIVEFMKNYLIPTDVVLLKGSRGMKMEKILELW